MRWLSIDPAEKTGLAIWDGTKLAAVGTLRPASAREAKGMPDPSRALVVNAFVWAADAASGLRPFTGPRAAWQMLLAGAGAVVVEESFGDSPKTVAQMGQRRGYIEAVCDSLDVPFRTINTSEWRRVCGERLGQSWPAASKAAKQRSIDLVREHCDGLVVTGDEGDAYWVGRAAMWLGLVTP